MTVSVIIPAYNAEQYIAHAIRSALEQSHAPVDVIVASDGSTDGTADVARKEGATVLELPKANGNVARNAGVRASRGELIAFLDADDWFLPKKLEAHVEAHSTGDWSCVFDPATTVWPDGTVGRLAGPALNGPLPMSGFTSRTHWYGGSSFTVRRTKLDAIDGWREELKRQQDIDLWLRLTHRHGPAFVMGESYTMFLMSAGSVSRTPSNILENLDQLLSGLPFLSNSERRRLRSHIIFTAVDNMKFPASLKLLLAASDSIVDPRWSKALVRSLRRTL
jgi:glycosyltransferase involved in cell wall biosynthesis